jgi:hypothetical protein
MLEIRAIEANQNDAIHLRLFTFLGLAFASIHSPNFKIDGEKYSPTPPSIRPSKRHVTVDVMTML